MFKLHSYHAQEPSKQIEQSNTFRTINQSHAASLSDARSRAHEDFSLLKYAQARNNLSLPTVLSVHLGGPFHDRAWPYSSLGYSESHTPDIKT
jgi:hypothetical protein